MGLQLTENKALSWGIIGKSAPILAEITIRKSQRLYVNGAEVSNMPLTGVLEINANPLQIGGSVYDSEYFAGQIDEVRIYNRALSPTEIRADMHTPVK